MCSISIYLATLSGKRYNTATLMPAASLVGFQQRSSQVRTLAAWAASVAPALIAEPKLMLLSASLCYAAEVWLLCNSTLLQTAAVAAMGFRQGSLLTIWKYKTGLGCLAVLALPTVMLAMDRFHLEKPETFAQQVLLSVRNLPFYSQNKSMQSQARTQPGDNVF